MHEGGIIVRDGKHIRGAFPALRRLRGGAGDDMRANGNRKRGNADRNGSGLRLRRLRGRYRFDRQNTKGAVHICKENRGREKNLRNSMWL